MPARGEVVARFTIDPEGRVEALTVDGSLEEVTVRACVRSTAMRLRFGPAPEARPATMTVGFTPP